MDAAASIIAILQLSAVVLGYLTDVAHASKERAVCAREVSNNHALLTDLRFRIEINDNTKPWNVSLRGLAAENGPLEQYKAALQELQDRLTDGGKLQRFGKALVWKFDKEEIASIQARIDRLKHYVQIALQMDHFKLSKAFERGLSSIERDVAITREDVNVIRVQQTSAQSQADAAERKRFFEWISITDYSTKQSDILAQRQDGTGAWFFLKPEVVKWLNEPGSTLFCRGMPGAGKTIMSAITVDHVMRQAKSSRMGVAFVFCQYKTNEKQTFISLLAALLRQLLQTQPNVMWPAAKPHKVPTSIKRRPTVDWEADLKEPYAQDGADLAAIAANPIDRLYEKFKVDTVPNLAEIQDALAYVATSFSTIHVIVDALDECANFGTRRELVRYLQELQSQADIRLLATSRFHSDIEEKFQGVPTLEIRASDEDIKRYVAAQIDDLPRCIRDDSSLFLQVQNKITEAVNGMFLLARFFVMSLEDKKKKKAVNATLDKLSRDPKPLSTAYTVAKERIEGQRPGDVILAKRVLSWVTLAVRPLTVQELLCALEVDPDTGDLDFDGDLYDIKRYCPFALDSSA